MRRKLFMAVGLLLIAGNASGQTKSDATDSQTQLLQAILSEIRQVRQDLRASTVAFQRAQILVHRVELQDGIVRRLQDKVDEMRTKLTQLQGEENQLTTELKGMQDALEQADNPDTQKEVLKQTIRGLKTESEKKANEEQGTQARLSESDEQLRIEQAKLGRLQDELDALDKTLQEASHR
jgi:chromosome segregation ATPase